MPVRNWLPLISVVLKEKAREQGINVPTGSTCRMVRKQAKKKNDPMSLVVNGYLTDFTRLKYISADFVLPWELPERDLNCYRSDYCSETERYIVSESDHKFDWQEASKRVENELAAKEVACKADREKEKALEEAARRAQYVHEQALKIIAFEKAAAEMSQSVDHSPLTPEAITDTLDNAAMVLNRSLDHTASSSDDALPADDSLFTETVAHIEDLLSKPASPERYEPNNADSLERNEASRMIVGHSKVELSLSSPLDPAHPCDNPNSSDQPTSSITHSAESKEAFLEIGGNREGETSLHLRLDPTHPCNKRNTSEENVACAPESNQSLSATVPDVKDEKALQNSLGNKEIRSPTDAPSPTSSKSEDTHHALSDGLPTSPLSACISRTTEAESEEDFLPKPSTSGKTLEVANPCENYTPGIPPKEKQFSPTVFKMGPLPIRTKEPALGYNVPKEEQIQDTENRLEIENPTMVIDDVHDAITKVVPVEASIPYMATALNDQETTPTTPEIVLIGGTLSHTSLLGEWVASPSKSIYSKKPPVSTFLLYFFVAVYILITLLRSLTKMVKKNNGPTQKMMSYFWSSPWALLFVLLTGSERLVLGVTVGVGLMLLEWGTVTEYGQGAEVLRHEGNSKDSEGDLKSGG